MFFVTKISLEDPYLGYEFIKPIRWEIITYINSFKDKYKKKCYMSDIVEIFDNRRGKKVAYYNVKELKKMDIVVRDEEDRKALIIKQEFLVYINDEYKDKLKNGWPALAIKYRI